MSAPALAPAPASVAPATGARVARSRPAGGWGLAFATPHALGLLIFTVVPIVTSLVISLNKWPLLGDPEFVGLANYVALAKNPVFRTVVLNTAFFVLLYLPANLVVSLGLAAWLTPRIAHRQVFRVLFFIPTITPIVANVVVWRMIYQPQGLIDATLQSAFGVHAPNFLADQSWAMLAIVTMSVWQGFGYNMLIFSAALD